MTAERVSVLIVDDDFYAREALRSLVAKDRRTRVWDAVASAPEAVEALVSRANGGTGTDGPDVLLLDVRIGEDERAGIDAIPVLREAAPDARILMTSVSRDEDVVVASIKAGADGYVWKNESTDGIAEAISRLMDGRFVVTRSVAERMVGRATVPDGWSPEILPEGREPREITESIRKTLYLYCFCGMSAREIADELQISVNTVNSRIKTAYQVLDAGTRREAFQRLVERNGAGS